MAGERPQLGKVQLQLMQILWRRGHATAREITQELSADGSVALSTVQTLLRQLEAKGAVSHTQDERVFVFYPVWKQAEVADGATRDLLERVFGGSVYGLVSYLLRQEEISPEELARLRELISKKEGEQ